MVINMKDYSIKCFNFAQFSESASYLMLTFSFLISTLLFQCAINCPQDSDLLLILITEATFKEAIYACMIVTKSLFTSNAR